MTKSAISSEQPPTEVDQERRFDRLMEPDSLQALPRCCRQTIQSHVTRNPMMVCPECKLMIKCFGDEKSYRNYITFCTSRGRRFKTFEDRDFYFVMYSSYANDIPR